MKSEITIRLPYRMSVADGTGLISGYDTWDYKIVFYQWDLAITGVGWEGESLPITVVTINAATDGFGELAHPLPNEVIRTFFLQTLGYLNRVIDSYRVRTNDFLARNILLGDLPPMVRIRIDDNSYLYIVNLPHWIANDVREDKTEKLEEVGQTLGSWGRWPQLMVAERFYASARQYFEQGDNFRAIVDLETGFEIKVRIAFGMIIHHFNLSEEEREKMLKAPLRNVVEHHLAKHLGGDFSYTGPGPIKDWYKYLYLLRNKCLHDGEFEVAGEEATIAFTAYEAADKYIGEKLVEKGYLSTEGFINIDRYAPRREIENFEDIIKARMIKAGFVPDESGFIRRSESGDPRNGNDTEGNA